MKANLHLAYMRSINTFPFVRLFFLFYSAILFALVSPYRHHVHHASIGDARNFEMRVEINCGLHLSCFSIFKKMYGHLSFDFNDIYVFTWAKVFS